MQGSIYWKIPSGGGILTDVIWGKKYEKAREKGENVKEKRRKGKEKEEKGKQMRKG